MVPLLHWRNAVRDGRPGRGEGVLRKGVSIRQKLADANPSVTEFPSNLADSHYAIGKLLSATGDTAGARASFDNALAICQKLADANRSAPQFQSQLAGFLEITGYQLSQTGRLHEALAYYTRAEAIWKTLVDQNPAIPNYQSGLANCHTNTAELLIRTGRLAEARVMCDRALAARDAQVKDHPDHRYLRLGLAEILLRDGQVRQAEGDLVGASADWRRAVALLKAVPALNGENVFIYAGCHASLSSVAGLPGTGISAGERDAQAEQAMALLRRAAAMGYRAPATYRTETALDPLRGRPDFRLLTMDLAFPAEPFAPDR